MSLCLIQSLGAHCAAHATLWGPGQLHAQLPTCPIPPAMKPRAEAHTLSCLIPPMCLLSPSLDEFHFSSCSRMLYCKLLLLNTSRSNPPFEQRWSTQASTASSVWPSSSHHPWRTCFGHPPTKCACEFVMRVSPSLCASACNARRPRIFVLLTTMPPPTDCVTHHEFLSEHINLKPNL